MGKAAQIGVGLLKLANYELDFFELDLSVPGQPRVTEKELDDTSSVNLGGFDNHLLILMHRRWSGLAIRAFCLV